jgi:hypothetical protein
MDGVQKIQVKPGHHIMGEVKDGMVHVHDIVHGDHSELGITGEKPNLSPIPVGKIEAIRKSHGIMEPISSPSA